MASSLSGKMGLCYIPAMHHRYGVGVIIASALLGLLGALGSAPTSPALFVEIRDLDGSPAIYVHGRPVAPLMFFGQPSIDLARYLDQVQLARNANIHLYSLQVPMPWPRPGESPDYSDGDPFLDALRTVDPLALVFLRFDVGPPYWWLGQHPDDRMLFEDGTTEGWSPASTAWEEEMLVRVREFVRHYESDYGDIILGYHPCGQTTGEWFYFGSWEGRLSDFSPAMNRGFRNWVEEKYGSVSSLQNAWRESSITFDSVSVPAAEEQRRTEIGFFRDPRQERKVIDYFEYKQAAMERPLERIARAVKEETSSRKLVGFFYGYLFEMHGLPMGPQGSGHLALSRLLVCPDVDIVCAPISYSDRGPGGAGCFMSAVDSVESAGKLWFNEDDTRTYLSSEDDPFGRAATPQQTIWIHQRNFSGIWPRRMGCWYMDLPGTGWLDADDLWENIERLASFYRLRLAERTVWSPEVVVVVDEKSPLCTGCASVLHPPLVYDMRAALCRLGTSVRMHLLSDAVEGLIPSARVYIFLNCFHLDARERAAVRFLTRGKTAVWFYGGGFLGDDAKDANITLATGIAVTRGTPQRGKVTPDPSAGILVDGVGEEFGSGKMLDPLWTVSDPAAQVLARFNDGTAAAAAKWTPAGLRVYLGTLSVPARLLRNILKASGVHLYVDSDEVVTTDGRFLAVTATSAGLKALSFPGPIVLTDALDGREIAHGVESLALSMDIGETRLFLMR